MPKELRCDHVSCDRRIPEADALDWLKLDNVGVDARALTNWMGDLPLYFCSLSCLRAFVTDRPR